MASKHLRVILSLVAGLVLVFGLLTLNAGQKAKKFNYGVTFSVPYAENLGLDWKKVYVDMLDDLGIKNVRVSAYWNRVEPEKNKYNFDELDFQVQEAEKHGAKVVMAIGRRLPRWPECHEPDWVKDKPAELQQNELLSYMEAVVRRYQDSPALAYWQVENEPFLSSFGICPKLDPANFDAEIALIKKLDPATPILITDSGELSSWLPASKRGDVFGTTLYRYVYSDVLKRYWTNYIPSWFYRLKAGYVRLLNPNKKIIIAELEAEPWTTAGIVKTPIEEQFKTMSLEKFKTITRVAQNTGFEEQYLWGVEWWYWMDGQGHPEFLNEVRNLTK